MSQRSVTFLAMHKQPRSIDNKQIVLDQSMDLLIARQENDFRIADVCEVSGLSSSVIYSYFRSREGLIDSTYAEIFKKVASRAEGTLENLFAAVTKPDQVTETFVGTASQNEVRRAWAANRNLRLRVSAHAVSCPSFMKLFAPLALEHFQNVTELFKVLIGKGIILSHHTAEECARTYEGLQLSWALHEGITGTDLTNEWVQILRRTYGAT